MKRSGPQAVNEIIEKIASGEYRLRRATLLNETNTRVQLEKFVYGSWINVSMYNTLTVRAAKARLKYRHDVENNVGLYEVAA